MVDLNRKLRRELNRKFKRDYDRFFKDDPATANMYLLLCELAAEAGGEFTLPTTYPEAEIQRLMLARFDDPLAYQFPGGAKR